MDLLTKMLLKLGPLPFLILINDLHKCMKYSKTYHFADDTSITSFFTTNLKLLSMWMNKDSSTLSN